MKTINPFLTHRFSCHAVGHLMTSLTSITHKQLDTLDKLSERKAQAVNGDAKPLTKNMERELDELIAKRDAPDELPTGAITHLDDIYRAVVWGRSDVVDTVYMEKGLQTEQDCLELLSKRDGTFYVKNDKQLFGTHLQGTPDVLGERYWPLEDRTIKHIIDVKASWNMRTFDQATLTSQYDYQVKGYMYLDGADTGEVVYCLVNSPGYLVEKEIDRMWYRLGQPNPVSDKWLKIAEQIERNMIFDQAKMAEDYPDYKFVTKEWEWIYDVPEKFRVKRFPVQLRDEDIKAFETRLSNARKYLIERYEQEFAEVPELVEV